MNAKTKIEDADIAAQNSAAYVRNSRRNKLVSRRRRTNNGYKKGANGRSQISGRKEVVKSGCAGNDLTWYYKDNSLLLDATSMAFVPGNGYKYSLYPRNYNDINKYEPIVYSRLHQTIPGVLVLRSGPTLGVSTNQNSPLNIAADNLFAYVRRNLSGTLKFDSTDLIMFMGTMDSLYTWYYNLVRVYGILNSYTVFDRYIPRTLTQSLGFDYDNLVNNAPNFRFLLNKIRNQINAIAVPNVFPLFKRHSYVFGNIFKDSNLEKSQFVVNKLEWVYTYDERTYETGGALVPYTITGKGTGTKFNGVNLLTLADITKISDDLINSILGSEDIGTISSAILKTYSTSELVTLVPVLEGLVTQPVFDWEYYFQVQNSYSVLIGDGAEGSEATTNMIKQWTYTQDLSGSDPMLVSHFDIDTLQATLEVATPAGANYTYGMMGMGPDHLKLLSLPKAAPNPGDVMLATRLIPAVTISSTTFNVEETKVITATRKWKMSSVPTELVLGYNIVGIEYGNSIQGDLKSIAIQSDITQFIYSDVSMNQTNIQLLQTMGLIKEFGIMPTIYPSTLMHDSSGFSTRVYDPIQDLESIKVIDNDELDRLHEVALLGELNVPANF